jgi:hypothetical protein
MNLNLERIIMSSSYVDNIYESWKRLKNDYDIPYELVELVALYISQKTYGRKYGENKNIAFDNMIKGINIDRSLDMQLGVNYLKNNYPVFYKFDKIFLDEIYAKATGKVDSIKPSESLNVLPNGLTGKTQYEKTLEYKIVYPNDSINHHYTSGLKSKINIRWLVFSLCCILGCFIFIIFSFISRQIYH